MSDELTAFLDDARPGPWRPEPPFNGEGLHRNPRTMWLENADGDSLMVDEDTAALLVNAALASPSLDVERLARALHKSLVGCTLTAHRDCNVTVHDRQAAAIARAYAEDRP